MSHYLQIIPTVYNTKSQQGKGYALRGPGKHRLGLDARRGNDGSVDVETKSDNNLIRKNGKTDKSLDKDVENEISEVDIDNSEEGVRGELMQIYLNPANPGSYGGVDALYKNAKESGIVGITKAKVKSFLSGIPSYTLHRQARRKFSRNRTYVDGVDSQWQADLADMQALSKHNDGYKYLLTCIDVFSKYAWAIPIKEKSANALCTAFRDLLEKHTAPRLPQKLQTDKGTEFLNSSVQKLFSEWKPHSIKHFTSWSDQKASIVERFNRTLKSHMWRYFSAQHTNRYIDILPKLLSAYNNRLNRAIGMSPAEASKRENETNVRRILYPQGRVFQKLPTNKKGKSDIATVDVRLVPGMRVRISKVKGNFEKGYLPNWSQEDFIIKDVIERGGEERRIYKLEDRAGEPIQGIFYREELQPISRNQYTIEHVIRKGKNKNGKSVCLIKWYGWPSKFNSWIDEEEINKYHRL